MRYSPSSARTLFLMSGKGLNSLKARLICSMEQKWRAHVIRVVLTKLLFRRMTNLA